MVALQSYTQAFDFAAVQLRQLVKAHPGQFPMYTRQGKWDLSGETWTNWCEGFLGGQLWLIFMRTHDPYWRGLAEKYSRLIEPRKFDREVHDLGFLFLPTWKRWYDLDGDPELNVVVVQAGCTLALRYQEKGRYLRSFLAPDSLFIDIMMNVPIIFYAAQQMAEVGEGERKFPIPETSFTAVDLTRIATQHCLTTRKHLVRGDGSTAHEGLFDLQTGQFLRQSTQQGWRDDSCWARGLAWALYGFGSVYQHTGDRRFLETAEACARFYIENTPSHGVPPNDWNEPSPRFPYESSAAAIAASGLLQLYHQDGERKVAYRDYALRILDTLCSEEFLAKHTPGWEGLLKHGMYHQRKGLGVDESVMWGDYFFLEALYKVLNGQ